LTHDYGEPDPEERRPPDAGYNPPFGATIFFHIPENYDGKTPATLQFTDSEGKVIRTISLHFATEEEKKEKESAASSLLIRTNKPPISPLAATCGTTSGQIREKEAKLSAIEPGMNRLQWNLRYPFAAEITGYHAPIGAGGLEDSVQGPVVVPGTYFLLISLATRRALKNPAVAPSISISRERKSIL